MLHVGSVICCPKNIVLEFCSQSIEFHLQVKLFITHLRKKKMHELVIFTNKVT